MAVNLTNEKLIEQLQKANERIAELERSVSSDAKFHSVIDASPVPFALNDEEQRITYLNPAFVRGFGYTLEDIPTLQDWWPKAYPNTAYQHWVASTWQKHLDKAKANNTSFEPLELKICCKDGTVRTVLGSAAPLEKSYLGNHLVILYDINERKKFETELNVKEKELAEIIDHLPSMIFLKEANELRYVRFNTAGEKLTGIAREDIIGKNDYDFFPPEQADFFTERDRIVLASGRLEDIADEPIDTPQGTRSLHTRKVAILDQSGRPKYLLGISDDITEKKKAETERSRLQRELQQVHKMESLGHLTGGIAHDFNNLLGIITGYSSLALETCQANDDLKMMKYLKQVETASNRATSLVSQMLTFSRNDRSDNQAMLLAPHIKEDIKMLRATLPATMQIKTDIKADLPSVMMNPVQLNQILMNLAVNARDAMDGVGELTVSLDWKREMDTESNVSHQPVKGDWIALSVKDTGCGLEPSMINDIFTPFFTSKGVGKGTGMGLAVVYGIMKNCSGHIMVDSQPGKGSCFTLLFAPLEQGSMRFAGLTTEQNNSLMTGNGEEILIVDDEQSLADYVGEMVGHHGYKATVMTDSVEALELFRQQPNRFPIVITDQTMPHLSGLEFIDQARKVQPLLPAILCSGYSDKVDSHSAAKKNIYFMQKPLDSLGLIEKIGELLEGSGVSH